MIDENIQEYAEEYTSEESDLLRELRQKTHRERPDKNMLSGFYQGRVLSMISSLVSPKVVLEIGTYMGYSALCLAEGLADDGRVITIDVDEETSSIAYEYWERAGLSSRIDGRLGDATEIIPALEEVIDLVFIDADKENYSNYFDLVISRMRKGGLIIADNVLWSGEVLDAQKGDDVSSSASALHSYNLKVQNDPRVTNLLLAVRDGLMIARVN